MFLYKYIHQEFTVIYFILCIMVFCNVSNAKAEPLRAEENNKLTGLVIMDYYYEQPNYGDSPESDEINSACMLKIDKAGAAHTSLQLTEKLLIELKNVHLLLPRTIACGEWMGHRVEVSGKLSEPVTGHQHGDAIMEVKEIKKLR